MEVVVAVAQVRHLRHGQDARQEGVQSCENGSRQPSCVCFAMYRQCYDDARCVLAPLLRS